MCSLQIVREIYKKWVAAVMLPTDSSQERKAKAKQVHRIMRKKIEYQKACANKGLKHNNKRPKNIDNASSTVVINAGHGLPVDLTSDSDK